MVPFRRFLAVLIATTLAGCGAAKPPAPPPPLVIAAPPLQRQVEDWDDFVGQFESPASVDIRPRVSGYVTAVDFKDGQAVARGQLLFQIDPRPYAAAFDQAKAQEAHAAAALADTKVELNRSQQLLTARATSQQDVDTRLAAERGVKAAYVQRGHEHDCDDDSGDDAPGASPQHPPLSGQPASGKPAGAKTAKPESPTQDNAPKPQ